MKLFSIATALVALAGKHPLFLLYSSLSFSSSATTTNTFPSFLQHQHILQHTQHYFHSTNTTSLLSFLAPSLPHHLSLSLTLFCISLTRQHTDSLTSLPYCLPSTHPLKKQSVSHPSSIFPFPYPCSLSSNETPTDSTRLFFYS